MKRLVVLLLALMMLVLSASCTVTDKKTAGKSEKSARETKDRADVPKEITFTEMVALDNDRCTIKVTGIDPDDLMGYYAIKVFLENKTTDTNYLVTIREAFINGIASTPLMAATVDAGKKANDSACFLDSFLGDALAKTDVTDIELTFRVTDNDDWTADAYFESTVHIYPYGEENATTFVRAGQPGDNVIIDNESVTVIVTGYEKDPYFGYRANLFLVNKTDKKLCYNVENASVNGYMADPVYLAIVPAGKCAFDFMAWSDNILNENNINSVQKIEFVMKVNDFNNWSAPALADEAITLIP